VEDILQFVIWQYDKVTACKCCK